MNFVDSNSLGQPAFRNYRDAPDGNVAMLFVDSVQYALDSPMTYYHMADQSIRFSFDSTGAVCGLMQTEE